MVENENKNITIDNKQTSIPLAKIQTRETDTVVRSQSGDIIIIGGLMQSMVKQNESGFPLDKKGLLGKIFSPMNAKQSSSKKTELVILLKPTIAENLISDMNPYKDYLLEE